MKILFFGDLVGKPARQALKKYLPKLKSKYRPDLVIANADNLAHGLGATEKTVKETLDYGIDFFTNGDHAFDKPEMAEVFAHGQLPIIRPANFTSSFPGIGAKMLTVGQKNLLVINLIGRVFIDEELDCPFRTVEKILKEYIAPKPDCILIDFHAEATSEKIALKHFLDGKISALIGTHTHIPTADAQITDQGTAYISDVGMVGPKDSVIGADIKRVLTGFTEDKPFRYEIAADKEIIINAIYLELDDKTGKAKKIQPINRFVTI